MVTLLIWIGQLTCSDRSYTGALSRLYAYIDQMVAVPGRPDTGAYCKARKRRCTAVVHRLYQEVNKNLEKRPFCPPLLKHGVCRWWTAPVCGGI